MKDFIRVYIDVRGREIEAAILDCRRQGRLVVVGPEYFEDGNYIAAFVVPERRERVARRRLEHLSRLGEQNVKKIYSREIGRFIRTRTR